MSDLKDGEDALAEEVFLDEDAEDVLLLDEFENDDTEDVSLSETLDSKIKEEPSEKKKTRYYPDGWSYKRSSRKIISPSGEEFRSRRDALKAMVNSEDYSMDEIEEMRSFLRHERWRKSDDLPRCWMLREGAQGPEVLGAGGEFFESLTGAAEFVRKYKEYFYEEDLDKFWMFVKNPRATEKKNESNGTNIYESRKPDNEGGRSKRKSSRSKGEDWSSDPFIPRGWKSRKKVVGGDVKTQSLEMITTEGRYLCGRKSALKFMIQNSYSEEEIKRMREGLITTNSWNYGKSLPENWLYRKRRTNVEFIDTDGNYHSSRRKLLDFYQDNTEMLSILKHCEEIGESLDLKKDYGKTSSDPSLPSGWSLKKRKDGRVGIISPKGTYFAGRRVALTHFIANNFPKDQILAIKGQLHFEGWSRDPGLPKDWLYKKQKKLLDYRYQYINESGHYFKTKEAALKHLAEKNLVEDQRIMENFIPETEQNKTESNKKQKQEQNLKDSSWNKSAPSGWRIKKFAMGKQSIVRVMSPQGIIFNGRRNALKFMIENQYPVDQVEEMRDSLKLDNWRSDPALPDKWLFKKKKSGGYYFVNQNGIFFENTTEAVASVGKNDSPSFLAKFTKSKVDFKNHCPKRKKKRRFIVKQENKLVESCPKKEFKTEEWIEFEDECLSGWNFMISASGSKHFRAPSGEVLRNRPQIETFLRRKNVGEKTISAILKGISKIGHKRNWSRGQRQ